MNNRRYPTAAEMEILVALKDYHYLTVEQVMLVMGRTSLRASQQRLKDLLDAGLVARHDRRSSNVLKPLRAAWSLTGKSKAYLEGAEMTVLPPRRPRPYTLDHFLTINDVLIRAKLLEEQYSAFVEVMIVLHDRDLKAWEPPLTVVPDGFIDFVVDTDRRGRESFPILLEVDMGTMDRVRWQDKVRRYLAFLDGQFQDAFETDVGTIAVIIRDDEKRLTDLKRWTEQELARAAAKDMGDLFYFTLFTDDLSPTDLFLSPRFLVAFSEGKASLLPADDMSLILPDDGEWMMAYYESE
jgi:Replication-relaxation